MSCTKHWPRSIALVGLLMIAVTGYAAESIPEGLTLESIEVWPTELTLEHRLDQAQLLLTGRLTSGEQIDVTRMAKLTTDTDLVDVSPQRLIRPLRDAATSELTGLMINEANFATMAAST